MARFVQGGQPVTEQSNELTTDIDTASPRGIVKILHACDKEIFKGWKDSEGINNDVILDKVVKIALKIKEVLKDPSSGAVVITGCGTSGRLAFLTARTFNRYLTSRGKEPCFQYIISGEDKALFTSQELAEDDPIFGAQALEKTIQGKSKVVVIGVTCGLSAPFVAGQLDYCLSHRDVCTPVLLGFNPSHMARNIDIQNWNKTFLDVVKQMEKAEQSGAGFILNPVIGPEPITGSSRMKSGSTTRILLETLSIAALEDYSRATISLLFKMYEDVCTSVYKQTESMASVIQLAGESLRSGGHIYYLGCDGFGLMGMIDASECVPTYGASVDDIRGFVEGGFSVLCNNDGDISNEGPYYRISLKDFEKDILPLIGHNDLIVLIGKEMFNKVDLASLASSQCKMVCVCFQPNSTLCVQEPLENFAVVVDFKHDFSTLDTVASDLAKVTMIRLLQEIAVKWVLNGVSTGAHILKGKVLNNMMIDVKVSNNKLFHRALGIIQKYSGASEDECRLCLLKSIYNSDSPSEAQRSASIEDHIKAAFGVEKVVPKAILLALSKSTVDQVRQMMEKQPIVRKLLMRQTQV